MSEPVKKRVLLDTIRTVALMRSSHRHHDGEKTILPTAGARGSNGALPNGSPRGEPFMEISRLPN